MSGTENKNKLSSQTKTCIVITLVVIASISPLLLKYYNPFNLSDVGNIIFITLLVAIFIIIYFFALLKDRGYKISRVDPLNNVLFKIKWVDRVRGLSYWPISHVLFFLSLTVAFPTSWFLLACIGLGWEIFEEWMSYMLYKLPNIT